MQALELKHGGAVRAENRPPQPGPVTLDDLGSALGATRPTVHAYASKYDDWHKEFGSV